MKRSMRMSMYLTGLILLAVELGAVESGISGIYLAGCCQGPKDIPDSVAQASAAAALACITLAQREKEPART